VRRCVGAASHNFSYIFGLLVYRHASGGHDLRWSAAAEEKLGLQLPPEPALAASSLSTKPSLHMLQEVVDCLILTVERYNNVGLNIKNDETYRLVEELAKLTGETLTGAVTQAVRERLDRLHRERGGRLADRLLLIGKDCAAHLKEPFRSADHGGLLYDDRGLPR
jgi:antitoxin VapB